MIEKPNKTAFIAYIIGIVILIPAAIVFTRGINDGNQSKLTVVIFVNGEEARVLYESKKLIRA